MVMQLQNELIFVKLLEIDKYCNDFEHQVISVDEELFKAFQYLTEIRNNFVHSNIIKDMASHLVRVDEHLLLTEDKPVTKYGICSNPFETTNDDVIRSQRIVEKIVVKIINALSDRTRYQFAIVHSYLRILYYIEVNDRVYFPLTEDDYVPDEYIKKFLNLTPELDDEYYKAEEYTL